MRIAVLALLAALAAGAASYPLHSQTPVAAPQTDRAGEAAQGREPDFEKIRTLLKAPVVFDGRNVYSPEHMRALGFTYFSIGR